MENFVWPLMGDAIDKKEIERIIEFISSKNKLTKGKYVIEFENLWSSWQGCKYSVFVNSGSSANLIMLDALKELNGWRSEDKIIVPAITWSTNISPIIQLGLEPIFVDVNLKNLSFDLEKLKEEIEISKNIVSIFITHLLGFPAEIDKIKLLCQEKNIKLIEDSCESTGALYHGNKVGNFGEASSFSFYFGHHMTTIEGGMVCTDNYELYKLLLLKRSHGLARELPKEEFEKEKLKYPEVDPSFLFLTTGYNFRNHEIPAIIGIEQLKKIDSIISKRNNNFKLYQKIIEKHRDKLYFLSVEGVSSFVLPLIFKNSQNLISFKKLLIEEKIEFRPILAGNLLKQPFLSKYNYYLKKTPNATLIHNKGIYLGNNQFLSEKNINLLDELLNKLK